ncbi:hypothetical protein [Bartonella grahamii]|uniref:hypothetical protein n=1 Tax=Bartonella grahamii TaxID=33045 RepID=UPI002E7AFC13|nr:hypothetical protein [Bartonella grahamii]
MIYITLVFHLARKTGTARKALIRLNMYFKYAAALGLDIDLQAATKAHALSEK